MKKIVCAGNGIVDIIKRIDEYPQKGMLSKIKSVSYGVGGSVCNTGITLKQLAPQALDVAAATRIGRDDNGKFLKSVFVKYGLNTERVIEDDALPTAFTDVMTTPNGDRTFFSACGACSVFSETDLHTDTLDCDIFHIGYLLLLDALDQPDSQYGTKMAKLLAAVQARGIRTSIDVVSAEGSRFSEIVIPALRYCDYVVINEIEASRIAEIPLRDECGLLEENLLPVCRKLRRAGVRKTVVVHCPELGCALTEDGTFSIVPSLKLPDGYIVGSVGAGDAFCAGMLYSFAKSMSAADGLRLASCAAACNLRVADSISGSKSFAETMALESKFERLGEIRISRV